MALTTTLLTGTILLPNGSIIDGSFVRLSLTSFDTDAVDVVTVNPYTVTSHLDTSGGMSVNLWPNSRGIRGTEYEVTLGASDGRNVYEYRLSNIVVPDTGTADFEYLQRV